MNAQRIETRRAYGTLRAIRDAFSKATPQEYFRALYDTTEEADAMYALHLSRCASITEEKESQPDSSLGEMQNG